MYFGGTIHLLREQDFPLPEPFDKAYEASSVLVFETDIGQAETIEFQQKLLAKASFPGDSTVEDVLNEESMKLLEKECADLGLGFSQLKKLRPSILIVTLVAIHYQKIGINSPGVDVHFQKRGLEDSKEILTLETVEEQIELITEMGKGHENEFVQHSLEDLKEVENELMKLINSWKEGKSKENEEELQEMKTEFPELYDELVLERNNNWLPQIEALFDNESTEFVLVGNLHLHGEDGLLNQLKNKGYQISQVK